MQKKEISAFAFAVVFTFESLTDD